MDNYITTYKHTICNLLDPEVRALSFWGYCLRIDLEERSWNDLSVERTAAPIMKVDVSGGPQFVMAHLNYPGHVGRSFQRGNASSFETYRSAYLRRSNFAARQLDAIVRHLEENDPGAILLVYGDHGTQVARGLKFRDNPTLVVQANYGVLGGIYPRETCAAWFDEAEAAQNYMTVLDAVHALLRCLSGGESALGAASQQDHFSLARPGAKTLLVSMSIGMNSALRCGLLVTAVGAILTAPGVALLCLHPLSALIYSKP